MTPNGVFFITCSLLVNTMILVQIYVDSHIDDEQTRLFSDDNADYAQQWAEVAYERKDVDFVKVQELEVI